MKHVKLQAPHASLDQSYLTNSFSDTSLPFIMIPSLQKDLNNTKSKQKYPVFANPVPQKYYLSKTSHL
jgi:hypothetical protein